MKIYGPSIAEGSEVTNLTMPVRTDFPTSPNAGELVYREDLQATYVHNGTDWVVVHDDTLVPRIGVNWTTRVNALDINWVSVCYGNGLFVACAQSGTGNRIMTSPDGINWTLRSTPADNNWLSVCYGNGLFVVVAADGNGSQMTSPDGVNWTLRSTPTNTWYSVCYGNGLFVAVGSSGTGNRVMTSPDGVNWTSRTSPADIGWSNVCYGNGLFVAVAQTTGTGNRVMTSPDGITWTLRSTPADYDWRSVCYGKGLFVAVSQTGGVTDGIMTSPDGITWTLRTSPSNRWTSVCYGEGVFVAVAKNGTNNRVITSNDGITWTPRTSAANNQWITVCYGNGMFVAVADTGDGDRVMTSGVTKTNVTDDVNVKQGPTKFTGDVTIDGALNIAGSISVDEISNGTSSVAIPVVDGDVIVTTAGSERLRVTASGAISTGGETAPDVDAGGICINTGTADGYVLTFKNSDVAHPMTSVAETDTYGIVGKRDANGGGLAIGGFGEVNVPGIFLNAYTQTPNTTLGNVAPMVFNAVKSNGTTGISSLSATDNAYTFLSGNTYLLQLKGSNGGAYFVSSLVTGGETAPDVSAGGLCINTGTADGYAQSFKNSDVAHPFSSNNEIDTYGAIRKSSSTNGGFYLRGIAAGTTPGIDFAALTQTGQTSGAGVINFSAFRSNGATSTDSLLATHNLATFQNATSVVTTIKGNGDIFSSGGIATGGETAPDVDPGGICINTGAGNGFLLSLKNSAISHGVTADAETDTLGYFKKLDNASGGLIMRGFSEAATGLFLAGVATVPNTSSSYGAIVLHGAKANGTGTQSISATESLFTVHNNSSVAALRMLGNGDTTFSGNVTAPRFISTVTTGTAPFVISSTTRVSNLNVATAGTADELTTARTINGTLFKGSANITTANWGTGRQLTIGNMGKTVNGSANVSWSLDEIGAAYKTLPLNTPPATAYELVLTDAGTNIVTNQATANTLTIPANSSVAFPVGTVIKITQLGAGQTTVNITTDTLNVAASFTTKLAEQYSEAVITKMTSTMWVISGDLEPV